MKRFLIGLFALAAVSVAFAQDAPLKVGDPAPDFKLPYATIDSVASDSLTLSSLVSKRNVVLAFYPADWSGGCTKEGCTLRDNFSSPGPVEADAGGISRASLLSRPE